MAINWFPGHMNNTRQRLEAAMPKCDVVIEVLDARLPMASGNPLLSELRRNVPGKGENGAHGDIPCITLLTKADLADPEVTQAWRDHLQDEHGVKTLAMDLQQPGEVKRLPKLIKRVAPEHRRRKNAVRTFIVGIPNVGKSTLVNALRGKRVAKVGNEPAVTRGNQEINLKNGIFLMDTPGILWPRFEDPVVAYRLAVSGAIKDTAIDLDDIAIFAAKWLLTDYPERLQERYKLDDLPEEPVALIEAIGTKHGCLVAGGEIDFQRASSVLLRELRSGKLGRLSLERPAEASE